MILVFGGTTEGKKVASLLDWLSEDYIYSTRNKVQYTVGGEQINGELDFDKATALCIEHEVKLIIDAAHPFAVNVHQNIKQVSKKLELPILRYSRVFQSFDNESLVTFFDSYEQMVQAMLKNDAYRNILALTGVQTITHFKSLWNSRDIYFRILNTDLSRTKAILTGVDMTRVLPEDPKADAANLIETCKKLGTQLLLSKESGESGFMDAKLEAAKVFNIPLWVLKKPQLPEYDFEVHSEKELLQNIYRLRKNVLKKGEELQSGFTTGVCVTACAKACFKALRTGVFPEDEEVDLESGVKAIFKIYNTILNKDKASCLVIKNSGDDPDVTHAEEIGCEIRLSGSSEITFKAGHGVGTVTMPGLQVSVGDAAINPGPRKLITAQINQLKETLKTNVGVEVMPFVPNGEALANHTFNPRIGIKGGISILGTTGVLRPFSSQAYVDSIRQYINVAINSHCKRLILTPGKRSENFLKPIFPEDIEQAFIHIGNFVGESLKLITHLSSIEIVLGIMLGKAIKLAEGSMDTHSSKVVFNNKFACDVASGLGYEDEVIAQLRMVKLANEIWDIIPFSKDELFYKEIVKLIQQNCGKYSNETSTISVFLLSTKGQSVNL